MELRQLRYFLSVADSRSFVNAANSLFISRQAVSKSISQLEEELGMELFVRDSSGAYLTPTGLMFYERIRAMVMELDSITEQIRTSGSRFRQRIRIGFSIGTLQLLESRLQNYRETRENLEISYAEYPEEACWNMLAEHQLDLVIGYSPMLNQLFRSEELQRSRLGVLLREKEGLEELTELDIRDLSWIPLAGLSGSRTARFCEKNNLMLRYQGYDCHRLFELTSAGKCGLLLPQCLVPGNREELVWLPLQQEEYWILYKIYPQIVENNLLYSEVLDDLDRHVLQKFGK